MGLAIYYRNFIEFFSRIAYPINSLENNENKFVWNDKGETSFQKLQIILSNVPTLKIFDQDGYFLVFTYACKEGLGGFLLEHNHVISYEAQKIKEH